MQVECDHAMAMGKCENIILIADEDGRGIGSSTARPSLECTSSSPPGAAPCQTISWMLQSKKAALAGKKAAVIQEAEKAKVEKAEANMKARVAAKAAKAEAAEAADKPEAQVH
eukprot:5263118-Pleurochrysis_carterae.AAC.1